MKNSKNKSDFENKLLEDVERFGVEAAWKKVCESVVREESADTDFGELYERSLSLSDKDGKKSSGRYYTPYDVAAVMARWLDESDGYNVCDVACGSGNLILAYLEILGRKRAEQLLKDGRVYLYDNDPTALAICRMSLILRYGELADRVNVICGDFLDKSVTLPSDCKVISNPPYAKITEFKDGWDKTETMLSAKELFAAFSEKILRSSKSSVVITPFGFIGGRKFYPLRKEMNRHGGFVVSFDNVPGNIFRGRKHGVFNTNTANSVRAAITVTRETAARGYRFTPLIRFKTEERERLLDCRVLEGFLSDKRQSVSDESPAYAKCGKELEPVLAAWQNVGAQKLSDLLAPEGEGKYRLFVPNTCRYFTVASERELNRKGSITLSFDDKEKYDYVYCLINSSFAYFHWRLYDGGITYPKNLLLDMPVFFSELSAADKDFFRRMREQMSAAANDFTVTKNNVGVQENIKFPKAYRDRLNEKLLAIIGAQQGIAVFDSVHSCSAFSV